MIGNNPVNINNLEFRRGHRQIRILNILIERINPPKASTENIPCGIIGDLSRLNTPTKTIPTLPIIPVIIPY